jgi:hypothetical protein
MVTLQVRRAAAALTDRTRSIDPAIQSMRAAVSALRLALAMQLAVATRYGTTRTPRAEASSERRDRHQASSERGDAGVGRAAPAVAACERMPVLTGSMLAMS